MPILAIMRHRAQGLINTARRNLNLINRGRASQVEIIAYTEASRALAEIRNPTAVAPLIRALKDRAADIRKTVATALGEIGDVRAVDPLIRVLQDKDSSVRAAAATALGKLGDSRAAKPLKEAQQDQDADVESAAIKAIKQLEQRRKPE
jgi:HEAT repeat protein